MPSGRPRIPMLFCERAYGVFFLLWGLILIADGIFSTSRHGIFFGQLERYMPGWGWGILLVSIGIGRCAAYHFHSCLWRKALSLATFILLAVIATLAAFTGLWNATAPLAGFVAYVAFWCHRATLRDLRLDL